MTINMTAIGSRHLDIKEVKRSEANRGVSR